jgi:hypothetical protein
MADLTPRQRRLKKEIEEICEAIGMDHWNIADYEAEARTSKLGVIKIQIVRGEVITKYILVDEFLTVIISHYYFKKPKRGSSFKNLWRTKKFQVFNHYVMDDVYLLQKMRIVHAIEKIPPEIRNGIERINAVRNAIAHSFFPENRRQYAAHKKVIYRGKDLFTKSGIGKFQQDFELISHYCWKRAGWI